MKDRYLYALWGVLFLLTAGLGLIPEPAGAGAVAMLLVSLVFFAPPGVLLYRGWKRRDRHTLELIRNLAMASLALTTVLLAANFLSVLAPEAVGDVLHVLLVILSAPMVCGGIWAVSLFLWACLLVSSITALKKLK